MSDLIRSLFASIGGVTPGSSTATGAMGTSGPEERADSALLQRLVEGLTNEVRQSYRRTTLDPSSRLAAVARDHSRDMCRRRFFDHRSPDRMSPSDRVARGFPELIGGSAENIFMIDTAQDLIRTQADAERVARQLVDGWMASPGHRANILEPGHTLLGVGVYATVDDVYATQLFARPLAILGAPLDKAVRRGQKVDVTFDPGPDLSAAGPLQALLEWPDRERRFALADGRSYLRGHQPLTLQRLDCHVRLEFTIGDLAGAYRLLVGSASSFYEIGAFVAR